MKILIPLISLWLVVTSAWGAAGEKNQPNIVLILADDLGYSDIGCYGGEIRTPHLDSLAARGARFAGFTNTSRCCPTRASLLTGRYPHQVGMGWMAAEDWTSRVINATTPPAYRGELDKATPTLAEHLRAAGYATAMTGKWHVTGAIQPGADRSNWPLQRGFDSFFGILAGGGSYWDPATLTFGNDAQNPQENFYFTDAITQHALSAIRRRPADKPLFLYVAYTAPHWPLHAPAERIAPYRNTYRQGWDAIRAARFARQQKLGLATDHWALSPRDRAVPAWESVANPDWQAELMATYAAMVEIMDEGIGQILAQLREEGMVENTLIVFLSDNGGCAESDLSAGKPRTVGSPEAQSPRPEGKFQHQIIPSHTRSGQPVRRGHGVMPGPADSFLDYGRGWANASNTPFHHYKHEVHQGGIVTPCIVAWAGNRLKPGTILRQPGHVIDFAPTFLDLAGATPIPGSPPLEGRSLLPLLRGEAPAGPRPLFFEHEGNRAVILGKNKLVSRGIAGRWELYNLETDPSELRNLADSQSETVHQLTQLWQHWAETTGVLPYPDAGYWKTD